MVGVDALPTLVPHNNAGKSPLDYCRDVVYNLSFLVGTTFVATSLRDGDNNNLSDSSSANTYYWSLVVAYTALALFGAAFFFLVTSILFRHRGLESSQMVSSFLSALSCIFAFLLVSAVLFLNMKVGSSSSTGTTTTTSLLGGVVGLPVGHLGSIVMGMAGVGTMIYIVSNCCA